MLAQSKRDEQKKLHKRCKKKCRRHGQTTRHPSAGVCQSHAGMGSLIFDSLGRSVRKSVVRSTPFRTSVRPAVHLAAACVPNQPCNFHLPTTIRWKSSDQIDVPENDGPTRGAPCWGSYPQPAQQISFHPVMISCSKFHNQVRISAPFASTRYLPELSDPRPPAHQLWTAYQVPFESYYPCVSAVSLILMNMHIHSTFFESHRRFQPFSVRLARCNGYAPAV